MDITYEARRYRMMFGEKGLTKMCAQVFKLIPISGMMDWYVHATRRPTTCVTSRHLRNNEVSS